MSNRRGQQGHQRGSGREAPGGPRIGAPFPVVHGRLVPDPDCKLLRCEAVMPKRSPDSEGNYDLAGTRCGMYAGHDGPHTVLIPTGAPWFSHGLEPDPAAHGAGWKGV